MYNYWHFFIFFKLVWKLEITVVGQNKKFGLISSSGRCISAVAEPADFDDKDINRITFDDGGEGGGGGGEENKLKL